MPAAFRPAQPVPVKLGGMDPVERWGQLTLQGNLALEQGEGFKARQAYSEALAVAEEMMVAAALAHDARAMRFAPALYGMACNNIIALARQQDDGLTAGIFLCKAAAGFLTVMECNDAPVSLRSRCLLHSRYASLALCQYFEERGMWEATETYTTRVNAAFFSVQRAEQSAHSPTPSVEPAEPRSSTPLLQNVDLPWLAFELEASSLLEPSPAPSVPSLEAGPLVELRGERGFEAPALSLEAAVTSFEPPAIGFEPPTSSIEPPARKAPGPAPRVPRPAPAVPRAARLEPSPPLLEPSRRPSSMPSVEPSASRPTRAEPDAALSEPSAALFDPSAALFEPNAALFEPSAALSEPSAALFEPNAALFEPRVSLFEPRVSLFAAGAASPAAQHEAAPVPAPAAWGKPHAGAFIAPWGQGQPPTLAAAPAPKTLRARLLAWAARAFRRAPRPTPALGAAVRAK